MEKYHPMANPMVSPMAANPMVSPMAANPMVSPMAANPMPNLYPSAVSPAAVGPNYPVNVHASYEEINIYGPKKHHHHHHHGVWGVWTTTGTILVLYILLVIVLRSTHRL